MAIVLVACSPGADEVASANLPNGYRLTIIRRPAHSFLAEYTRLVRLALDDSVVATDTLLMDTGGHGQLELLELGNGQFVLRGPIESHVVDTGQRSIARSDSTSAASGRRLGVFDADPQGQWHFVPSP